MTKLLGYISFGGFSTKTQINRKFNINITKKMEKKLLSFGKRITFVSILFLSNVLRFTTVYSVTYNIDKWILQPKYVQLQKSNWILNTNQLKTQLTNIIKENPFKKATMKSKGKCWWTNDTCNVFRYGVAFRVVPTDGWTCWPLIISRH